MFFKKSPKGTVQFNPFGIKVPIGSEPSVLDLALKHKIPIDHSCGGSGSCGTCRVKVTSNRDVIEPMNFVEEAMAKSRSFLPEERLACQFEPVDGLVVFVPAAEDDSDT